MTTREHVFPLHVAARSALRQGLITQEGFERVMADLDRQELNRSRKTEDLIRKAFAQLLKLTEL